MKQAWKIFVASALVVGSVAHADSEKVSLV